MSDNNKRGTLKLFFGYTESVWRTDDMLREAKKLVGRDPHPITVFTDDPGGIEIKKYGHIDVVTEIDPDQLFKNGTKLVAAPDFGLLYTKVGDAGLEALLSHGVTVYGSLRVNQIESIAELLRPVFGARNNPLVPGRIFDNADDVRFIDRNPGERGESMPESRWLAMLRELAIRRLADRLDRRASLGGVPYPAYEHILVCISGSPSNKNVIRAAAHLASETNARFTALYVETYNFMNIASRKALAQNIALAESLGATIANTYGPDMLTQISEFSRFARVTKIFIGQTHKHFGVRAATMRLMQGSADMQVYIIPDENMKRKPLSLPRFIRPKIHDILVACGVLFICAAIGNMMSYLEMSIMNIAVIFILGDVLISWKLANPLLSTLFAVLNFICLNYFFEEPKSSFSMTASDPESFLILLILVFTAFVIGRVTERGKKQATASAKSAYNTDLILTTSQSLNASDTADDIAHAAMQSVASLLQCPVSFYWKDPVSGQEATFSRGIEGQPLDESMLGDDEKAAASQALALNLRTGRGQAICPDAGALYIPLGTSREAAAAIGVYSPLGVGDADNALFEAVLGQISFAIEKLLADRRREQATISAENERLKTNLLRAISHDLRTPLTGIIGSAELLMTATDEKSREDLAQDICREAHWMTDMTENVISVSRMQEGPPQLNLSPQIVDDIIDEAITHVASVGRGCIKRSMSDDIALVRADSQLMMQMIVNLLNNALSHAGCEANVAISSHLSGNQVTIDVSDNGSGVPDDMKESIFELFYSANRLGDKKKGLGVGLPLSRSIAEAHGGTLEVLDNVPKGSIFRITLPAMELKLDEGTH